MDYGFSGCYLFWYHHVLSVSWGHMHEPGVTAIMGRTASLGVASVSLQRAYRLTTTDSLGLASLRLGTIQGISYS